jgi:hypothetical protein
MDSSLEYNDVAELTNLLRLFSTWHDDFNRPTNFSVRQMMQEILLSYHLIFRNESQARRNYRKVQRQKIKSIMPQNLSIDPLLDVLCGYKDFSRSKIEAPIRTEFTKATDFPVFTERLSAVQTYIMPKKPAKLKGLWNDRRDFNSWYTFWAVIGFGTLGVLLNLCQVALVAVQTAYQIESYRLQQATATG